MEIFEFSIQDIFLTFPLEVKESNVGHPVYLLTSNTGSWQRISKVCVVTIMVEVIGQSTYNHLYSCKHLYSAGCKHLYSAGCKHLYSAGCKHLYSAGCKHLYSAGCKHLYSAGCKHLYSAGCKHLYSAGCEHLYSAGCKH